MLLQCCNIISKDQEVKVKKTKIKGAATAKNDSQGEKQCKEAGCILRGDNGGEDKRHVGK